MLRREGSAWFSSKESRRGRREVEGPPLPRFFFFPPAPLYFPMAPNTENRAFFRRLFLGVGVGGGGGGSSPDGVRSREVEAITPADMRVGCAAIGVEKLLRMGSTDSSGDDGDGIF